MGLIDFILNLAALLLWLGVLSVQPDLLTRPSSVGLVKTLHRTGASPIRRWMFAVALIAVLIVRAMLYSHLGSMTGWTPKLDLGAITLSFRSDFLQLMLAFSALSFAVTLSCFYSWLLLLSCLGQSKAECGPFQQFTRSHLGVVARWRWPLRVVLPFCAASMAWLVLCPLLNWLGLVPKPGPWLTRGVQAALLGLSAYITWKPLMVGLLALYLVQSYVHLGNNPIWSFVAISARTLLRPLRVLPLKLAKVDFAPLVGLALVLLLAHVAENGLTLSSRVRVPSLSEFYQQLSR